MKTLHVTLTESLTGIASIIGGSAGTWGQSEVQDILNNIV